MQAVVIHETGGPDVLHYEEAERPEPGDGQVLIRVQAASVNPADWKARRGLSETRLPAVLGRDASGTVEVSRAEGFAEGDDVFGARARSSWLGSPSWWRAARSAWRSARCSRSPRSSKHTNSASPGTPAARSS
jgi:NADPH:quinone reductase-like Zn-dependent oxidoreductase